MQGVSAIVFPPVPFRRHLQARRSNRLVFCAELGATLSDTIYLLIGFRKSTLPQNRQLIVYYY